MEITYKILEVINWVAIFITSLGVLWQLLFTFLGWIKPKKFKKAKIQRKFAIIIPARNESKVIGSTVTEILEKQNYPKELFDVFVCADNCTDNTAEAARNAGATVIERFEKDPKKRNASYPVKALMNYVLDNYPDKYDAFIRFDADNKPDKDFISSMNDALESGVEIARAYEASSNATQNTWSIISATYYIRDSRIVSNFRERTNMNSMLSGAGMMVTTKVIKDIGGWDAMSNSEDAEFAIKRMLQNYKCHYVPNAIVFEDQPSTLKDTWNRLTRMGNSLHKVFWKDGWKLLFKTFHGKKGGFTYFDMFYTIFFMPISIIATLWFPAYYIFYFIINSLNAWGPNANFLASYYNIFNEQMTSAWSSNQIIGNLLPMIGYILGSLYFFYTLQTFLAVVLSKKELGITSLKGYWKGIFLSAPFMFLYDISIVWGILTNSGWKEINRNVNFNDINKDKISN